MSRLSTLLSVLRPRALARTAKLVDDLTAATQDLRRTVKELEQRSTRAESRASALHGEVRALNDTVAELRLRESRLRAIYCSDLEAAKTLETVEPALDADAI